MESSKIPPDQLIRQYRSQILAIAAAHGAVSVKVFGSMAKGDATSRSDLDLLVDFKSGYSLLDLIALKQDLEDLLGCQVDIVTEAALSPYIRDQVVAEAIPL